MIHNIEFIVFICLFESKHIALCTEGYKRSDSYS